MQTPKKRSFRRLVEIQPIKLITLSFLVIIIAGTLLLLLPISTREGQSTSLLDALFTSTSAYMRNRPCNSRYLSSLDSIWTGSNIIINTIWWIRACNINGIFNISVKKKIRV